MPLYKKGMKNNYTFKSSVSCVQVALVAI